MSPAASAIPTLLRRDLARLISVGNEPIATV
jgi:hypothetical protein